MDLLSSPGHSIKLNFFNLVDLARTRTTYDEEFKMMAVNLCHTGKTAKQVAMELGIMRNFIALQK